MLCFLSSEMSLRYVVEDNCGKKHLLQVSSREQLAQNIRDLYGFPQAASFTVEYFDKDFDCFVICPVRDLLNKVRIKATLERPVCFSSPGDSSGRNSSVGGSGADLESASTASTLDLMFLDDDGAVILTEGEISISNIASCYHKVHWYRISNVLYLHAIPPKR